MRQVYAESAREMLDAVLAEVAKGCDALISAAAVADYTLDPQAEKIKSGQELVLHLMPTQKIIKTVREAYPHLKIVGFKAETGVTDEELPFGRRGPCRAQGWIWWWPTTSRGAAWARMTTGCS